ncbi:methionyl-tRNA formyltransferase [Nonomuraea cavernae]|uniref:methionyl-tRNA formyltransferase n=1 Tax=Nonomuraea cavernae TaxID=2045107 RepID=UPI0033F03A30
MRVVLVSYSASGFKLLTDACAESGNQPVAYVHARTLRQRRPTSSLSAETVANISQSLPAGADLLLPGSVEGLAEALAGYRPDLILVYGLPWKLSRDVLQIPRLGAINVHTSLLPKYRGPLPVHWAVRNGDPEIGVTIHWMDDHFDTGNMLIQQGGIQIEEDLVTSRLWKETDRLIGDLLAPALRRASAGDAGEPQDETNASYAGWMEPDFMFVDWSHPAGQIHNQVRTFRFNLFGLRGPFAKIDDEWVTVLRTRLEPVDGLRVECGDGPIWITDSAAAVPVDR